MKPVLTVTGVILSADFERVVLHRRGAAPFASSLGFPGGHIEPGESPRAALEREIREELHAGVTEARFLGYHESAGLGMLTYLVRLDRVPVDLYQSIRGLRSQSLAPNTWAATLDALSVAIQDAAISLDGRISSALHNARNALRSSFREGDKAGWNHYLAGPTAGVLGTSLGILGLRQLGGSSDDPQLVAAVKTLRAFARPAGGWSTSSLAACGSPLVVDSTVFALKALRASGVPLSDPVIQQALAALHEARLADGSWETVVGSGPRKVYSTALAAEELTQWGTEPDQLSDTANWLIQARTPDGAWGALSFARAKDTVSGPAYTAYAVRALQALNQLQYAVAGRTYLRNMFRTSQDWSDSLDVTTLPESGGPTTRYEVKHFAGPTCAAALLSEAGNWTEPAVAATLIGLLSSQQGDGSWRPTPDGTDSPTWAMFGAMTFLRASAEAMRATPRPVQPTEEQRWLAVPETIRAATRQTAPALATPPTRSGEPAADAVRIAGIGFWASILVALIGGGVTIATKWIERPPTEAKAETATFQVVGIRVSGAGNPSVRLRIAVNGKQVSMPELTTAELPLSSGGYRTEVVGSLGLYRLTGVAEILGDNGAPTGMFTLPPTAVRAETDPQDLEGSANGVSVRLSFLLVPR